MSDVGRSVGLYKEADVAAGGDAPERLSVQARRTRRALWSALIELLGERPLARIRVSEICERALVHRVTFYKHFENKHDLLERGSHEAFRELSARLVAPQTALRQIDAGAPPDTFRTLFSYARDHRELIATLLRVQETSVFRDALTDSLDALARARLAEVEATGPFAGSAVHAELAGRFAAGAIVAVLDWWLTRGCEPSVDEMSRRLGVALRRALSS